MPVRRDILQEPWTRQRPALKAAKRREKNATTASAALEKQHTPDKQFQAKLRSSLQRLAAARENPAFQIPSSWRRFCRIGRCWRTVKSISCVFSVNLDVPTPPPPPLQPTYYSTGESIVRLRNIERSEPEPALFRPSDYQIVDDGHDHAEIKIP